MSRISKLQRTLSRSTRRIIGLMSGMSMDGVDLALVRIGGEFPELEISLEGTYYHRYAHETRSLLKESREGTVRDVCRIDFLVAEELATSVQEFLSEQRIEADEVDAIGSHGQAICHVPPGSSEDVPSTLQVGAGQIVAERTGIPTVFNFRIRDIAVGGQGAPLIPLVDFLLYRQTDTTVALNNLGSISNVTVVTPNLADVFAFDTGPANMPIDFFAERLTGVDDGIDRDGELSAQGTVQTDLLAEFLSIPFLSKEPPKSASYREFGPEFLRKKAEKYSDRSPADLLRTAVEFSAESIATAYERFVLPRHQTLNRVTFTGGGSYNTTLMRRIADRLSKLEIVRMSESNQEMNDFKEALGFAVLANETLSGRCGNVPGATGAREPTILGDICP